MKTSYDPFVIRRLFEDRVFLVNAHMPFEFFIDCFHLERPFFMIWQLEDGRIAITPNMLVFPNFIGEFEPVEFLPKDFEYVTMRTRAFPVMMTAHPVFNFDQWLRKFEGFFLPFCKQTLAQFVTTCFDLVPVKPQIKATPREKITT